MGVDGYLACDTQDQNSKNTIRTGRNNLTDETYLKHHKKGVIAIFLVFSGVTAWRRLGEASAIDMADTMRASGKIYVVVLIIALLFIGLLLYTIMIDRKVSGIEKEMQDRKEKII